MPYNIRMKRLSSLLVVVSLIIPLGGCSVPPSESEAAREISEFFEGRGYRVVELQIGRIEGLPLSEKTYMGTPGYTVDIDSITLEPRADKGPGIEKGQRITFSDARVRLTQERADKSSWRVTVVSGITVL